MGTNVNTNFEKRKRETRPPAPAADFLQDLPRQFDDDAMGEYDRLFGIAGRTLNLSFDTVYAIGGLVDLVRANAEDGDRSGLLSANTVSAALTAISLLSASLNDTLCDVAHKFRSELKEVQR